jgi:hypothetical protein
MTSIGNKYLTNGYLIISNRLFREFQWHLKRFIIVGKLCQHFIIIRQTSAVVHAFIPFDDFQIHSLSFQIVISTENVL